MDYTGRLCQKGYLFKNQIIKNFITDHRSIEMNTTHVRTCDTTHVRFATMEPLRDPPLKHTVWF